MWLPEKFYELLPYLYAILGMATLGYFDTPLGYGSGLLLLLTACLVWMMRRDFRQGRLDKKN